MVGVSNPMMQGDRRAGWAFLGGFGAGLAVAAAVVAIPLMLLGAALGHLPQPVRGGLLAVLLVGFGVADLLDRTPHVWRQVPQRFIRTLPPGPLGFVWAVDLGLLVTTQKTTSLIWIGLAGLVLGASPIAIGAAVVVISAGFGLLVAVSTVVRSGTLLSDARFHRRITFEWTTLIRRVSGLAALALAIVEVVALL
jgi:hypothetical protein